jgi:hypothetical protein
MTGYILDGTRIDHSYRESARIRYVHHRFPIYTRTLHRYMSNAQCQQACFQCCQ